jgi:hypothetical protein
MHMAIISRFGKEFIFFSMAREDGANRDSARHTNFPKQYAPTCAEPKNNADQNHAAPLSSNLMQRVATKALKRATMLAPTSKAK